jgi:hypothetical protein
VDIPAKPGTVYVNQGWAGMGDWLGTGTLAFRFRKYRPFKRARAFARRLSLNSKTEWEAFAKRGALPPDIPASPWYVYRDDGWSGIKDWLGTNV